MIDKLRNIAIIAHVDHGKTTLVDCLLQQSGTLDRRSEGAERIMDSNDQERERGITILAKNTAIRWQDYRINIVDTPGHADFGGEVERVLSMVDSVLLLVDAVDGPMPQTRFVTAKAFERGLRPIVVVNKVDRPGARPDWVVDQVFDLFDRLGATEEQLDFPVIFASAIEGVAGLDHAELAPDMEPLFETIVRACAGARGEFRGPAAAADQRSGLQQLRRGDRRGSHQPRPAGAEHAGDGGRSRRREPQRQGAAGDGLSWAWSGSTWSRAEAGDIVCVTGIEGLNISDTLCDPQAREALPPLTVDEPTVSMTFQVNDSPFAGKEGKYVTSRNIKERLERELIHNVALRVEPGDTARQVQGLRARRTAPVGADREHATRGFRAGRIAPRGDSARGRRRAAGALRATGYRLRGAAPGFGDGRARAAPGRAGKHGARRQGAGAAGVHRAGAGPDRLPLAVPDPDLRQRHPDPRF